MSQPHKNNRWWIWLPLLGLAAWLAFFADKTPVQQSEIVNAQNNAPRTSPKTLSPSPLTDSASASAQHSDRHLESLISRDQLYPQKKTKSATHDLFASSSWTPPPPPRPAPPVLTPAAPTTPALPFTYIGKKLENSVWEVYVVRGEQSFVLRAGTVIDNTYRVQSIAPPSLSLIYLPLGQTQTLAIGESQ